MSLQQEHSKADVTLFFNLEHGATIILLTGTVLGMMEGEAAKYLREDISWYIYITMVNGW